MHKPRTYVPCADVTIDRSMEIDGSEVDLLAQSLSNWKAVLSYQNEDLMCLSDISCSEDFDVPLCLSK